MALYSTFPATYDILSRLQDGLDRVDQDWWNTLAEAPYQIETALGTDPSNPGTAWATYSNVQQIMLRLARMEYGQFRINIPFNNPATIYFKSGTSRFLDKANMIVLLTKMGNDEGPNIPRYSRCSAQIQDNAGSGTPDRFDFWHADEDGGDGTSGTETWRYLALEENL